MTLIGQSSRHNNNNNGKISDAGPGLFLTTANGGGGGGLFGGCMGNGSWLKQQQQKQSSKQNTTTSTRRIQQHPDETDAFLAKEMNQLSLAEREQVLEEIHGIPQALQEDPELVEEQLKIMEAELSSIKDKKAYDRALFLSPRYVKNRKFRLLFLRSERMDGKKAATKMVNHFQFKLELFGIEKLVKDIEFEDLSEDDKDTLMDGHFRFLPEKDSGGRAVLFSSSLHIRFKTVENEVSIQYYDVFEVTLLNIHATTLWLLIYSTCIILWD
jgi:hypothetical protein